MPEEPIPLTIFVADEHVSVRTLQNAVRKSTGPLLCVFPPVAFKHLDDIQLKNLLLECRSLNKDRRLIIATKDGRLLEKAEHEGWETVKTLKQLKPLIKGQLQEAEALRTFSPVIWRENIRSRLQAVGLLSVPKFRIWTILGLSIAVFIFTFFKLLPSSEIFIWPDQESGNFTTNVYLATSGAVLPVANKERVRTLPLHLLTVHVDRTMTYDQISKNFTGENSRMTVTVFNDSDEAYSLRRGTRLINQAGMKFRLIDDLNIDAKSSEKARAEADPIDQFGQVTGSRGNVPAGVKWDFPGLTENERKLVYGRNEAAATGGTTSYVSVLTTEDIEGTKEHPGARQRLEQELLTVSKQQVSEEITARNNANGGNLIQLQREELTLMTFKDFQLSENFVGQSVTTIPIQGSLDYTVVLYDENDLLNLLKEEILRRVPEGKVVIESSLVKENMNVHVIPPWDDDLLWVKITADLTYTERYILNPLTPTGAKFGKYIRDNVAGKSVDEAYRIINNLPEVSKAEIRLWPPWAYGLPEIGTSIAITEKEN